MTAVIAVPVTVAENCCVVLAVTEAITGLTVTDTAGVTVTVAVPVLVVSATLVAVTITRPAGTVAGAVYAPVVALMLPQLLPQAPPTDQVTNWLGVPVTVAMNGCVVFTRTLAVGGDTETLIGTTTFRVAVPTADGADTLCAVTVNVCETVRPLGEV